MPSRTALLILLVRCCISSFAQNNVTIDDGDPAIAYTGTWTSYSSPLDASGSHRLGTDDGVLANFTFTGTAIYFMSPLWPYEVFTQLQLDSQSPVQLNLSDPNLATPSQNSGESVQSAVVWWTANLPNVSHTLQISKAPGRPYAIVDTLIYTRFDSVPSSSSSSSSFTGTSTANSFATSPPVKKSSQSSASVLTIALTTVFGSMGVCVVAITFWVCCKRRRRQKTEKRVVNGFPSLSVTPQMGPLSPEGAPEYKNTCRPVFNSQMTSLAPLITYPQPPPIIYQPSEMEQNFSSYITPPQTRMTYQQFLNPYLQQKETFSFSPTSLSTITEKSTPVIGAAGSPISLPSTDLSYYTAGSRSISSGAARLSYASDASPGAADNGAGHQRHFHAGGSPTLFRSTGSFSSLGQEVTRSSNFIDGKDKQAAVNKLEDEAECSRSSEYRPR